jgi:hypothetical protein
MLFLQFHANRIAWPIRRCVETSVFHKLANTAEAALAVDQPAARAAAPGRRQLGFRLVGPPVVARWLGRLRPREALDRRAADANASGYVALACPAALEKPHDLLRFLRRKHDDLPMAQKKGPPPEQLPAAGPWDTC